MRNPEARALVAMLQRTALAVPGATLESRWSRSALRAAVRAGEAVRILPGLFVAAEHETSLYTRAHAATTWVGPTSVLIGQGAASVWGLCDVPTSRVEVSAAYGTHRSCPDWLRVSRLAQPVPAADWRECRIATPAWAAVTAFARTPRAHRDRVIYLAVQRGLVAPADLASVTQVTPRVGDRHHLLRLIAATAEGAESHLETLGLRTVFAASEFARFIRQHRVRVDGASYRLDMFDPETRTAIELDGSEAHGLAVQRSRDVERDARLATVGILTVRFTYEDIADRADWCRAVVRKTLAARVGRGEWA